MPAYSKAAPRWVEPLLALCAGGQVTLRFLGPSSDPVSELGILGPGEGTFADYVAPRSYVRELTGEELETPGAQFRQGAREVLLPDSFLRAVAAAQGQERVEGALEAAAGLIIRGQLCRIKRFQPLETGDQTYAWQIFCDAPLEVA
jgi:hypothetical protein